MVCPLHARTPPRFRRTHRALLHVGRALFTDLGYPRVSMEAVVRRVGVTRGAFYYHFPDKTALFTAVFEEVCRECIHAVQTRMETAEGETWERFMASLEVLLEQLGHPGVQRIVYADGPAVLGWARARHGAPDFQFLHAVFTQLRAEGVLQPLPLYPCVYLVRAMCFEAARSITQAEERAVARRDMTAALKQLLDGLRVPQEAGP